MMFGHVGNADHEESVRIIHKALDAGINFIDTADAYSRGESEEIVGKALKGRRDNVVVATKAHLPMGDDPNMRGNSRRWLTRAVEDSLRRLGTDHIDLYQVHRPDPETDIEETLSALTGLMRAGKVRAIGASGLPAAEIVEAHWVPSGGAWPALRTEQPPYSILNRGIERDVLPTCQRYGMGVMVWSPLAMGMLTGRYRKGREVESRRTALFARQMTDERRLDAVEQLVPLAEEAGLSLTHMAIAFAIAHPGAAIICIDNPCVSSRRQGCDPADVDDIMYGQAAVVAGQQAGLLPGGQCAARGMQGGAGIVGQVLAA